MRAFQFSVASFSRQLAIAPLILSVFSGCIFLIGQPVLGNEYQPVSGLTSWEIGRVANLKEAALNNYFASDANRQAVELALIREIADACLTLRFTRVFLPRFQTRLRSRFDFTAQSHSSRNARHALLSSSVALYAALGSASFEPTKPPLAGSAPSRQH